MGLFDSYSTPVDQIQTGFGLNVSSQPYAVVLTDVRKHVRKSYQRIATILTFTVDPGADKEGRKGKQDVFINKPVDGDQNAEVTARNAKIWVENLGIPKNVYTQDDFEIWDHKDKLVGNVRGYLLVTQNGEYTNYRFTRVAAGAGETGPSEKVVPETKAEEPLDMDKLLADDSNGTW